MYTTEPYTGYNPDISDLVVYMQSLDDNNKVITSQFYDLVDAAARSNSCIRWQNNKKVEAAEETAKLIIKYKETIAELKDKYVHVTSLLRQCELENLSNLEEIK
jgi:hypothetical protein